MKKSIRVFFLSVSLIIGTIFSKAIAIEFNQECTSDIFPTFEDFYADGGEGNIEISADSNCYWTVISNEDWIIIKSGSSGNGDGDVIYSVSTNNTGVSRTGTITVDGKIVNIDQDETFVSCKNTPTNAFCFPQYKQEGSFYITGVNKYLEDEILNGTGFLIAPDLILTNSHNFGNDLTKAEREEVAKKCTLYFNYINTECKGSSSDMGEGLNIIEKIEKESPGSFKLNQKDYSVLKLNKSVLNEYGIEPLAISNNSLTINEDIYSLGHPGGEPRQIHCGKITKLNLFNIYNNYFVTNIISSKGSSGGPIISNQFSEVIGIHTGGDHETESYGLKLNEIYDDIKDIIKPSPTELISPAPNTTLETNLPMFTWKQINRAENYILKVEPLGSGAVFNRSYQSRSICNNEICSVELIEPLPNGEYTWKVQTSNKNGGYGEYSSTRNFLITDVCSVILSSESPNHIITSACYEKVYGTSGSNEITLESGARAELINFPGQNSIQVQASSDLFTVSRTGTVVTFQGTDSTVLKIPATTDVQTIDFTDREPLTLSIHDNKVMLDDQEITSTPAYIIGNLDDPVTCGAYIAPGVWKEFDCYNLAAIGKETGADPFTTSWELNGGYWQWGRKGPEDPDWYNTNTEYFAHGPTENGNNPNSGFIPGWVINPVDDSAWGEGNDKKTDKDPCPEGFRVPTIGEWQAVLKDTDNNPQRAEGTWSPDTWDDFTNYGAVRFFGEKLMLPAAGYRSHTGELRYRGVSGYYWSSSEQGDYDARLLLFNSGSAQLSELPRLTGGSVRCIADTPDQPETCGAHINGEFREFDCYNLAAIGKTTNDDPFTPSWRLIGGYWQWGRKGPDPSVWYDTNTEHFAHGPTEGGNNPNSGFISGWSNDYAEDGAWYKDGGKNIEYDPCPEGFRVPTKGEWQAVLKDTDNNPQRTEGSWSTESDDYTNYGSARYFGEKLMLPAAGLRLDPSGALYFRGSSGYYWSSSDEYSNRAWFLYFGSGDIYFSGSRRLSGCPVRCISEE